MANRIYPSGRQKWLEGDINWLTDNIKVTAVKNTYAYSDAHDFLDDVLAATRIATSGNLAGKISTAGVADSTDLVFPLVPAGETIVALVVWKDTGVEATSPLLAYYDTKADGTPISLPTSGADITVAWNNGNDKMWRL